jgi:phosphoglycerate dehydrogenase-like enzyme
LQAAFTEVSHCPSLFWITRRYPEPIVEPRPLTLLVSKQAARDFGDRITAVLPGRRFCYLHPDDEIGEGPGADIAFLTREVSADSGKTVLAQSLLRFYEHLRSSPDLRWMQTHSAGADRPIYRELRDRKVIVTTSSGANATPVAQMALTGLLMLARRLPELGLAQQRRTWSPLLGDRAPTDLRGQIAVIVGLGAIGLELARLLKMLGLRVLGVRKRATQCAEVDETLTVDRLSEALERADWLLLTCPLTEQTRGLIDARAIQRMPSGARIINVSRGEVLVEADLIAALQSGHLGGAHLDVFVQEPLDTHSLLWQLPNVIITPHSAGHTSAHYAAVGELFLQNLARWRDRLPLRNAVD